ncbi:MAG TPA: YeeE/YedE thiosulfate transporter family protein [Longimicrobiales bacterium]|nr:YeeE/YedE thiosulfate transporter family protein [Longimicrobiales bacterium]
MTAETAALVAAPLIGIAFGWFLERGGLGSARKLSGLFYLADFTVFRVLFSAVVTAMLGVFWLGRLGVVELSSIHVPETFLAPQAVGGAIFGIGFLVAGLCPGTSCVAGAAGRMDGFAVVGGLLLGVLAFNLAYPLIAGFVDSTALGALTLPQVTGLPYGVVVLGVTAFAIGGFALAARLERPQ